LRARCRAHIPGLLPLQPVGLRELLLLPDEPLRARRRLCARGERENALRGRSMKVVVAMPAYNVERTLVQTYEALPASLREHVMRGHFDVIQANRIRSRAESLAGGMPAYRYFGNRALTMFENIWFGVTFGEWHSGMRAYRKIVLETLPLESYPDTHAFASDI